MKNNLREASIIKSPKDTAVDLKATALFFNLNPIKMKTSKIQYKSSAIINKIFIIDLNSAAYLPTKKG